MAPATPVLKELNVIFVAQRGELGLKAALLAWSLRLTHGKALKLHVAVPGFRDWGQLEPELLSVFSQLEVELVQFSPPFAPEYPIGNKTRVLGLLPAGSPGLFLDSDMLSLDAWDPAKLLVGCLASAKPADVPTWGQDGGWEKVFSLLGAKCDDLFARATVTGALMPAYFNAGVVAAVQPTWFAAEWERYTGTLHREGSVLANRYPWLDQIALAALARTLPDGAEFRSLSEYWNYPAHLRPLPEGKHLVGICHYHRPEVLLREPALLALVRRAFDESPELGKLAWKFDRWRPLFRPRLPRLKKSLAGCDFIITGIPRSGTSLVCRLLDDQKNWLVVNEPAEVFSALEERRDASGIAALHRDIRENILVGKPVANKVDGSEVISDTASKDERVLYHPNVSGRFFRLGSKNTLAYMAALGSICELGWPVVAMVRHPMDTLASWRNTFSHLRSADVSKLPVANPEFHGWSGWQRQWMLEISAQQNEALRRVLLWRLLARTLLAQRHRLYLWRYEDLVKNPSSHIRRLRRVMYGKGWFTRCRVDLARSGNESDYCEKERRLLREFCSEELGELGYEL